ncbi:MAG: sulfotransferase family protein [Ktedonobacteraceae bacterium]
MTDTSVTETSTRGLKVIGAGFGRTGTLSTKAALEELGLGPCYHMTEVFSHPEDIAYWEAASRGESVNWHQLFERYQSAVDWPECSFYEEIMKAYPDAKVLLTVRDPQRWYESVISTIYQVSRRDTSSPFASLMYNATPKRIRRIMRILSDVVWEGTFAGKFEDAHYAKMVFTQHIEEVKQRVPPEKLLVYDVKEGWEPLCTFLGVEVPHNKPFPHLNERANFIGTRMRRRQELGTRLALGVSIVAVLLFVLSRLPIVRSKLAA